MFFTYAKFVLRFYPQVNRCPRLKKVILACVTLSHHGDTLRRNAFYLMLVGQVWVHHLPLNGSKRETFPEYTLNILVDRRNQCQYDRIECIWNIDECGLQSTFVTNQRQQYRRILNCKSCGSAFIIIIPLCLTTAHNNNEGYRNCSSQLRSRQCNSKFKQ